jgi:hypothetical protein
MISIQRRSIAIWLVGLTVGASSSLHAAMDSPASDHLVPVVEKAAPVMGPILAPFVSGGPISYTPAAAAVKTWAVARQDVTLVKAPDGDAPEVSILPTDGYVKVLRTQGEWAEIAYGGERDLASPAVAWARRVDFAALPTSPRWVRAFEEAKIWPSADARTPSVASLPRWSWLELTGEERAGRFAVRYPGDGRRVGPGSGWIDAATIVPVRPPDVAEIPWGYPATLDSNAVRIGVPYRTQLDDTPWASANCGPTALTMGLEYLGQRVTSARVRRVVLDAQDVHGDDAGTYVWALAAAADRLGARAVGLSDDGGQHRWTTDDVHRHLEKGEPVILQVAYRALPGRERAPYGGDHYVIVTGLVADGFLYNDPVDSDGLGYDRVMTTAELDRAMNATDRRFAHAGFALAGA